MRATHEVRASGPRAGAGRGPGRDGAGRPAVRGEPTDVTLTRIRHAEGVAVGGADVVWILAVGSDARPG